MDGYPLTLQPLVQRIERLLPAPRAALATALARCAYGLTAARHLRELDLDAAVSGLDRALEFIDQPPSGSAKLRVGPANGGTGVEVHCEDTPFLLGTVTTALDALGCAPVDLIHPVFGALRDTAGRLTEIVPARGARHRESYLSLRVPLPLDPGERAGLATGLEAVLGDLSRVTSGYEEMSARLEDVERMMRANAGSCYDPSEVAEVADLLGWFRRGHLVLLGFTASQTGAGPAEPALGLLAGGRSALDAPAPNGSALLTVSRTVRLSTVYRRVPMVWITVPHVRGGAIAGAFHVLGLYAQKALVAPSSTVPVLRRKLARIIEDADLVEGSHDERALRLVFDAFPKHELFEASEQDLGRALVELLETSRRREPRVLLRPEVARRSVSALVAVPKERFSESALWKIQRLLDLELGGRSAGYHLALTEWGTALLHFRLDGVEASALDQRAVDEAALEGRVATLLRTLHDDLEDALVMSRGAFGARRAMDRWGASFPAGYAEGTDAVTALEDVGELERLRPDEVIVAVRPDRAGREGLWHVRLYRAGPGVAPSQVLPLLESLGLRVVEEVPYRLDPTPLGEVHIHDYAALPEPDIPDPEAGPRAARAVLAMWDGRAEVDSLNRLVLRGGLEWDDVAVLRAYRRYRRQLGTTYTEPYTNDALVRYPEVARAVLGYFEARLAPGAARRPEEARERVVAALGAVERLDQHRILGSVVNLIDATIRTNRWKKDEPRADALAFKIDPRRVDGVPKPVPDVEVFVYSPRVEGVHLRAGPVSRGGVRYSDRQEDFRTEVLGLMQAQIRKNAVTVPTGAKGGFVVKRAADGSPSESAEPPQPPEVRRHYETYVRALLDVTDNVVDGQVVYPRGVCPRDGEDPYLVVAADRGTGAFSDVANAISEAYGFWLGDAFASGGRHGYDHKAMGITARGAWTAVQRHFRELGVDVQTEPITIVGVGDMSGDVFGNGLLRSCAVKLVAAFDHRDIFLDPDPDPASSYAERQRLFERPGSSWRDYDRALLSAGGGVWSRNAVAIPLAEPARRLLGVQAVQLSPPEVIRAILQARVDLLFFGGIGTFVKASTQTHADVGDHANDEVRIDATAVRARVIAEGANLGITQRGRIEYSLRGGRCNTDSIDNSAGVATSDREVNLKILLATAPDTLGAGERDELLRAMEPDVARAVIRDVALQTWAISQELAFSPGGIQAYEELMADLVARGRLDRAVEALPTTEEVSRRRAAGAGLARPELAVLLAYAKVDLATVLLGSSLPDQPYLARTLHAYFPRLAVERFGDLLERHRLRRELVATLVANDVLNRMGITWVNRTAHELGCDEPTVVAAYWAAREVADADGLYGLVEALDTRIEPLLQMELEGRVDQLIDAYTRTYIRHGDTADIAAVVTRDSPAFHELEKALAVRLGAGQQASGLWAQRYEDLGVDTEVAQRVGVLADLALVPDVAAVARASGRPVPEVCEVFVRLSGALPLDALRRRLAAMAPDGRWERWQHQGLLDELGGLRRAAATRAVAEHPGHDPGAMVKRFLDQRQAGCERVAALIRMIGENPDLHAVAVAVRALHDVV